MELSFGYSPCPNDTYMFASIADGSVGFEGNSIVPVIHDVDKLNSMAFNKVLDISKLSFYAYFKVKKTYQMLLSGGAMGFGCGPVLISKRKINKKEIRNCRIVFPGEFTTAHLLFRLWEPYANNRIFTTYDKIFNFLESGRADCGVIIHESRFTFEKFGFQLLVDLGAWWETITGMPIPLGCIVARKSMGDNCLCRIDNILNSSLKKSNADPRRVFPYIKKFAQELSDDVLWQHICTFVNEFSLGFGNIGLKAIDKLGDMAHEIGAIK